MITPGAVAPRRNTEQELYVVVLSTDIPVAARTGRVIVCPFIPGRLADDTMAMVIAVDQPAGTLLPELVQWLPSAGLGEPIGIVGGAKLRETTAIVTALMTS